mmetsp:Transcript_64420/g.119811  ORF Transcript_64420/g.119811 Transcript_64420/m.119811 type:complete len:82 (+) Transcript_64420:962-1207(+)
MNISLVPSVEELKVRAYRNADKRKLAFADVPKYIILTNWPAMSVVSARKVLSKLSRKDALDGGGGGAGSGALAAVALAFSA